jgi:hypothetical protein
MLLVVSRFDVISQPSDVSVKVSTGADGPKLSSFETGAVEKIVGRGAGSRIE